MPKLSDIVVLDPDVKPDDLIKSMHDIVEFAWAHKGENSHCSVYASWLGWLLQERAEMLAALKAIVAWANGRCTLQDGDGIKICPLCDADAEFDACRAVPATFPKRIVGTLTAVIAKAEGAQQPTAQPPYPFCHTPERCAEKGRCQSEIACND